MEQFYKSLCSIQHIYTISKHIAYFNIEYTTVHIITVYLAFYLLLKIYVVMDTTLSFQMVWSLIDQNQLTYSLI